MGGKDIVKEPTYATKKGTNIKTLFSLRGESTSVKKVTCTLNCIFNTHCIMILSIIVENVFYKVKSNTWMTFSYKHHIVATILIENCALECVSIP